MIKVQHPFTVEILTVDPRYTALFLRRQERIFWLFMAVVGGNIIFINGGVNS